MTTKQQERDALNKIREIIAELGEDSYLSSAFDGAFSLAEQNIEYDAAFTMQYYIDQANRAEKEAKTAATEIENLKKKIAGLEVQLEKEQEWQLYESDHNVKQVDYEKLASYVPNGSHYMTDEEAKDWICSEFDFDRDKITIIHEIDEEEVNRHRHCRRTGRKIDRRPIYCATDYHYIRFNTSRWYYEVWNDHLRPFYC